MNDTSQPKAKAVSMHPDRQVPNALEAFKKYMELRRKWIKISELPESVTYEMHEEASKGSCIIALTLLCFFVIPGILYLYYTNKPSKTHRLHVELLPNGDLHYSGSNAGRNVYLLFLAGHKMQQAKNS